MAKYAHIENNKITGVYDNFPLNWRNISNFYALSEDKTYIESLGWRCIEQAPVPSYDPTSQKLSDSIFTIEGNIIIETKTVETITSIETTETTTSEEQQFLEKINIHNIVMSQLREYRNQLLKDTDYTQLNDIVEKNGIELTTLYKLYRQELRDLPNIYKDDYDINSFNLIVWPNLPTSTTSTEPSTDSGI